MAADDPPLIETQEQTKNQQQYAWKTLKTLSEYLWEFRTRIIVAVLFLIFAKVANVLVPILLKAIVDWFDQPSGVDKILVIPIFLVLGYGALRLGRTLFEELRNALFSRASQRAVRNIALRVFRHLHRLSHKFHQDRETGGVSRDIERGTRGINTLLWFVVFSIVPTIFELSLICVVLAINFEAHFVIITMATVLLYGLFTYYVTTWRTKFRVRMNAAESRANAASVDALLNYETVKYFNNEEHEVDRFDKHMKEWEKQSVISEQTLALLNVGQGAIISIGVIILLYLAAEGIVVGELTIGDFIMLNAFLMQIYLPLSFLGTVFREISHALTDMNRMFNLMDVEDVIPETNSAPDLAISGAKIEFKNVNFGYSTDRTILRNVSFEIPSGKTVAVVGKSGSGKSTLVRLLFRFYDVTQGSITIDDQDIREVSLNSLHSAIGVVPQDTVLFNDTIEYNVCYGRPGCSSAQFDAAIRQANLSEFIQSLPEKFDTVVGERGLKLSGGEKQRVSIARTILKNPPVLILDEATSSLDSKSEQHIQKAFDAVARDRTTLIIAHRLSTIADADQIIVLDDGEIAEQGTHDELLKADGIYAEMWWLQQVEKLEARIAEIAATGGTESLQDKLSEQIIET